MRKTEIEHCIDEMNEIAKRVREGLPAFTAAIQKVKEAWGDKSEDRSYPHCDETGCLQRQGGGLYCKREDCDTRQIFVDYAGSFREDPKPGDADQDKAPERWNVIAEKGHYRLESTWNKRIALSDGIPIETAKAMAAASELRDALKGVHDEAYMNTDEKQMVAWVDADGWQMIVDALEKAGG